VTDNLGRVIPVGPAVFKSNFECGNISSVALSGPNAYDIELEKETNSNRVSNWFYFSVEGLKGEARFVIKGFTKSSSLYNEGMKVCYREANEFAKWRRGGTKISYTNSVEDDEYKDTYELRFSFFFKSNERTCVEFACCFPYGLKRLHSLIVQLKETAAYSVLGKSFNGLDIPLLTIGNADSKEVIVISARVHPGETVSSFIAEGFLKELAGEG
jgi:cytosolic carboxypeptidase protein 2/3